MRDLQARMLAALLEGDGLRGVAELAAEEAGAPVAIVLPARGLAAASSDEVHARAAVGSGRRAASGEPIPGVDRAKPRSSPASGDRLGARPRSIRRATGCRMAVRGRSRGGAAGRGAGDADRLAVTDARDEVAGELRGSLLEDLRARAIDGPAATREPRRATGLRPARRRSRPGRGGRQRAAAARGRADHRRAPRRAGRAAGGRRRRCDAVRCTSHLRAPAGPRATTPPATTTGVGARGSPPGSARTARRRSRRSARRRPSSTARSPRPS